MSISSKRTDYLQRGFTLIELMVTISVLAILLAIAIPDLRGFVLSNRLSSDVNGFMGLINYARSEAIARNQDVVVCPKANGAAITCQNTQFWGEFDLQVFVDTNGNSQRDATELLLKTVLATDPSASQRRLTRASGAGYISFSAGGYSQTTFRFDIFAINASDVEFESRYGRSLCISKPGRARVNALGSCV